MADSKPRVHGLGGVFFDSLPPFTRTREVGDVTAFFAAESGPTQLSGIAREESPHV